MRKLFSFFILLVPITAFSQYFSEAPKLHRPVKQIIEWQTVPPEGSEPEQTFKGGVYDFRRDGKLSNYASNDSDNKNYTYIYDNTSRLVKVHMDEKGGGSEMKYTYGTNYKKAEITSDSLYLVTTHFLDKKGRVVEEKTSGKAPFTLGKFTLLSRKVLNYNELGEVFGEMEYLYSGNISESKKTVHRFDPKSGKKIESVFYDNKKKVIQASKYEYDNSGKLAAIETKEPDSDYHIRKEFKEKNGKPWLETEHVFHEEERTEKVFKDGRLIRIKYFSDDELYFYTDFQYTYY